MRIWLGLFLWFMAVGAGWAEQSAETRFGTVSVVELPWRNGFVRPAYDVAGEIFDLVAEEYAVSDISIWEVIDWGKRGDVVIVGANSGGMRCCLSFGLFHLTADGVEYHSAGGGMASGSGDVVVTDDTISFKIDAHPDFVPPGYDYQAVVYDGASVQLSDVYENEVGAIEAGAGDGVTRWLGESLGRMFKDPSERLRFLQITTREELDNFRHDLPHAPFDREEDEGFVIASHCTSRSIRIAAIDVESGKPYLVDIRYDKRRFYGTTEADLPKPIRERLIACMNP